MTFTLSSVFVISIVVLNQCSNGFRVYHLTFLTWLLYSSINYFAASLNWLDFMIIKFFKGAAYVYHVSHCLPIVPRWSTGWTYLSHSFFPLECRRYFFNVLWHRRLKPTDIFFLSSVGDFDLAIWMLNNSFIYFNLWSSIM